MGRLLYLHITLTASELSGAKNAIKKYESIDVYLDFNRLI
jgi:hypothetical protein